MMYHERVHDYFFHPLHLGVIDVTLPLVVLARMGQKNQTVQMELYLQGSPKGRITQARFRASGNPYLIAALECVCRHIEGRIIEQIEDLDYQYLIHEFDIPTRHYPLALQVMGLYQEAARLMKNSINGERL